HFLSYFARIPVSDLIILEELWTGKTYQDIASRPNEWLRQWARIILVVERGLSPQQRLNMQKKYSQLRGKRTIIKIWKTTVKCLFT
ncbi:unnamed protein product, partial [Oppiella nova]